MDSSTLTVYHIGDLPDIPRPDGAVLAVALAARDVAVGVRAGSAVARLPGAVGIGIAVRVTITRRQKPLSACPDTSEHTTTAGRAVPLQLRPGPRRKHRLRVAQSHQ